MLNIRVQVDETAYEKPTEWRMRGGEGKAEHVMALCARHSIAPSSLLEVGAGDGAILRHLGSQMFCAAMHAVEISRSGVQVIRDQNIPGLASCQTFDGYTLPFPDKSIDLVIMSHVLEHVEFERALLREIRRVSTHQVIEIPMDWPALTSENYHFLGPSYGHINAYTPEALRFLLSTEGFRVVDDMLGQYSLPVQEYDYFVNNSRAMTPEAVQRFRTRFCQEQADFDALAGPEKARRASFYAVLARREEAGEKQVRAVTAAKAYINADQVQAARLVFKHFIPPEEATRVALDIAQFCRQERYFRAGVEFADIAVSNDPKNTTAQALRAELQAAASTPSTASDAGAAMFNRIELLPGLARAKYWLKVKFPGVADLARTLRKQK